ncbi:MAG: IS256 family transposase [Eggerthellaceae bacterium]
MRAVLIEYQQDLQTRSFEGLRFPYLWLDATYMKCRDGGHVSSTALVTAIACGDDGYRHLVGLEAVDTESYLGWRGFLQSLRERGVEGVVCVTSDAHEGLWRAIGEVFPGAAWQRCVVHLERNAMSLARNRRQRAAIGSILHAVFAERDPALARELYHLACEEIASFNARAAELLEDAEADTLAYLDFPYDHHRRLRANNVQERANREIKRRSSVVQVFPSRKSLIRMVGAVLSEMDEGWSARRWFDGDSVADAYEDPSRRKPAPEPAYEGTAAERAARIMALVLSGGVDPTGKAA